LSVPRVTLIGLDGVGLPLVEHWCKAGELPGFSALMEECSWCETKTTIPNVSPTAWTSILTGVNPGKHGIYGFVKRRAKSYSPRPISRNDMRAPPLWRLLSENGLKSAWVGIPFIYPPEPIRGILIAGLGTPSKRSSFTYPPELREEILARYPDFDVDFSEDEIELSKDIKKSLPKIDRVTDASIKIFKDLRSDEEYRLVGVVFRALDVLQHYVRDPQSLLPYLRRFDELILHCKETLGPSEVLVVCSDHGFRKVHSSFRINNWLHSIGLMRLKGKPLLGSFGIQAEVFQKLLVSLGLRGLVWRIKRSRLAERVLRVAPSQDYLSSDVDWPATEAYYLGNAGGAVFLNIKGREPAGAVERGPRYSEVVDKIITEIQKAVDPRTGLKPVGRVYKNSEVYSGSLDNAPDVLFEENEGYSIAGGYDYSDQCFTEIKSREGDHSTKGILFVRGNNIRRGQRLSELTVYDIAPTILQILGVPIPSHFDGRVLTELLDTQS